MNDKSPEVLAVLKVIDKTGDVATVAAEETPKGYCTHFVIGAFQTGRSAYLNASLSGEDAFEFGTIGSGKRCSALSGSSVRLTRNIGMVCLADPMELASPQITKGSKR